MTTQTKGSMEKTISILEDKLVGEKIEHISTILHYEYDLRISQLITLKEAVTLHIACVESELHQDRRAIIRYEQDEIIECDAENEALRIWNLFHEEIAEVTKVSKADLHEFLAKALQL
ncbi:hypothetical protein [Alicyclobacillus suci]|uniref:hypothetical protein n=1 Tax=Alicyclobacillus suci TaxID=2816080 RepID=UPI001A8D2665|nr:hypothetical protein [Alicyclobacillus suci]